MNYLIKYVYTKVPKQESQHLLRSPNPEGEPYFCFINWQNKYIFPRLKDSVGVDLRCHTTILRHMDRERYITVSIVKAIKCSNEKL